MPRPLCACRSPAFALSSWNLQNPPRITPLHRPMATIFPMMFVRATSLSRAELPEQGSLLRPLAPILARARSTSPSRSTVPQHRHQPNQPPEAVDRTNDRLADHTPSDECCQDTGRTRKFHFRHLAAQSQTGERRRRRIHRLALLATPWTAGDTRDTSLVNGPVRSLGQFGRARSTCQTTRFDAHRSSRDLANRYRPNIKALAGWAASESIIGSRRRKDYRAHESSPRILEQINIEGSARPDRAARTR
jgi:hypothetical protein